VVDKGNTRTFFSLLFKVAERHKRQKVYMVLDNVRFHHAKRLKPVLERYSYRMELVFLPPCSPGLNPIERVWWLMRKRVTQTGGLKPWEKEWMNLKDGVKQYRHYKLKRFVI
ncbi:hypothetical protein EZS27_041911, partial [termite gut metagenome]